MRKIIACLCIITAATALSVAADPKLLDDQFDLPPGFHIYRAATAELSGGSYALTFDGSGRLLVGDGNAVRRLADKDGDGVYDSFEVIATDLGWRGPQGLLVYGDKFFAVGGDGLQFFEGYTTGRLIHKGRLGGKLLTGNDHDAHEIFRGHDGYLYFVVGNGAEAKERVHISETNSPVLFEREACVFRISPDGRKWECLSAGGRNPPNLGMNYLGDLFSFDSDMEWHVGLPWYRPVRLNQWFTGGDLGWQEVGAYPPYFIDNIGGILEVGRGSPTWGTFYEHNQFPEKYQNSYVVCDYRWKVESNDQYDSTGRLVLFSLTRNGPTWKAAMETLAKPKPNAKDAMDKPINFALVDCQVAPDGSLFVTDHNQGIWRIYYAADRDAKAPEITVRRTDWTQPGDRLSQLLNLPQPSSEWARLAADSLNVPRSDLENYVSDPRNPTESRLRALRYIAPQFSEVSDRFVKTLSTDQSPELRGQAAWLLGLRGPAIRTNLESLLKLIDDHDPFVRRRAAEALTRFDSPQVTPALIKHLNDSERVIRFICMDALAHRPTIEWFRKASSRPEFQIKMRTLVASHMRRDPPTSGQVQNVINELLIQATSARSRTLPSMQKENTLDFLRVLALFQKTIEQNRTLRDAVASYLLSNWPERDPQLRWEKVRLLGLYRIPRGFPVLVDLLESEPDRVTQFHIARMLSRIESGWTPQQESRAVAWFIAQQQGWFTEFNGKGVEFPHFWLTVLTEFGQHHSEALLRELPKLDFAGQLGGVALNLIANAPNGDEQLMRLFVSQRDPEAKIKTARALKKFRNESVTNFLRSRIALTTNEELKGVLLQSFAAQSPNTNSVAVLAEGLRNENTQVARECADALAQIPSKLTEDLVILLLSKMTEHQDLFAPLQQCLATLSKISPPKQPKNKYPDETTRKVAMAFWRKWFEETFHHPLPAVAIAQKSDAELHQFILSATLESGDPARGVNTYEAIGCNNCHGGGVTPGREGKIFGPDLSGVTRRLSRLELADAIVFPSKQIAERFKASEVEVENGVTVSGFITEQTSDSVTIATRDEVLRIPKANIHRITAQTISLMPEHLLNGLKDDDILNLLSFLENGSAKTPSR